MFPCYPYLEEISSLCHSIVFLYFFALFTLEDFLISPCYSLELCSDECIFPFLFAFCLFSQLFIRPPQTTILAFCISFSWGWLWLPPPIQCHKLPSIVLQVFCLSDLIPWIYLSLLLYNHKGFDYRSYLNGLVVFPIFFNLSLNFAIRSSWSEPHSPPSLVFADCIELLHLQLQRIIINLILVLIIGCFPCVESYLVLLEEVRIHWRNIQKKLFSYWLG